MSYLSKEQSSASGEPIELYSFRKGTTYWTYTSSGIDIVYGGRTYVSKDPIRHSDIELSLNSLKNLVKVEVDRSNAFAANYIFAPLDGVVEVIIYRGHDGDYVTYWKGYVYAVGFNSKTAVITLSPKSNSLKRSGLTRKFSRRCNYPLYSTRCTQLKSNYKVTGVISSVTGKEVVATILGTKTDNWFLGGMFESGDYTRMINYHNQSEQKIKIIHSITGLAAGDSFNAFAGCDHTAATCKTKFSIPSTNKLNYGGQEFLPNKNPFSGDSIEY